MPWTIAYGSQGVELVFSGRCGGEDLLGAHEAIYSHRYTEGLQYIVADFSLVEYLEPSLAELLRIADHDRQYLLRNPPYLVAFIAPQALVLGMLRTYVDFMEGSTLRTQISSTRSEALAWLRSEILEVV
jgi:hypothetical protein